MMRESKAKRRVMPSDKTEIWTAFLLRCVMRLLLVLDQELFHGQFRTVYTGSSLANHPLLQFYDQHIKLLTLSEELLDDILPRIHLQWSQITEHALTQEENPARGQIDWQRTIERASNETPGQLPLRFATRLRQQHSALPENLLTVAILLQHRQLVHNILRIDQQEEIFINQERELLVNIKDHLVRELSKPQVRTLTEEAQKSQIGELVEQVKLHLHPGPNPYRDLLDWWEHFSELQIGSATTTPRLSLAHSRTHNAQMDLWLYELWIALELIVLLQERHALVLDTLALSKDQLSFTFLWNSRRYRFRYQHRGMAGATVTHHWEQIPTTQSSYLIERENPLSVEYKGKQIWQEPPVVVDVAYTADTGEATQRLLGNMAISTTVNGLLISPYLADPPQGTQASGEARYARERYSHHLQETRIELYKMTPDMPLPQLQERLLDILQHVVMSLPERQQSVCSGMVLDQDSSNASGSLMHGYDVLCPKPHVGPGVYDLVSRERHCLQDPRLCHVIGQTIMPPQVKRVVNLKDLKHHIEQLRSYGEATLKQAEEEHDEEKAELFRTLVLQQVGEMIEQFVKMHGDTALQEKFLRDGIFREYWERHAYCLEPETRHMLISGEYVWDEYQKSDLDDWAAPAVQYCRALEREIKRRFYTPIQHEYKIEEHKWTLGSIKGLYYGGHPKDWQALIKRVSTFHITKEVLVQQFMEPMVVKAHISDLRNKLAHGQPIDRETAESLRDAVLGDNLLKWMVKNIGP
jgi:hypothetical protein